MNKITQFLKQDKTQRICYAILLICWICIFLNPDTRVHITSYTAYMPVIFIVPVLLFVLQVLFNNKIIWVIIVGIMSAYTVRTFLKMMTYVGVDYHRDYGHSIQWNAETIFRFTGLLLSFLLLNWFLFKISPIKKL